jgi:hypothetical protein
VRTARLIGLAAVAALALMASVGVGAAFAAKTTLCKTNTISPYCEASNRYPAETAFEASSSSLSIEVTTPKLKITCSSSAITGKTNAESGEPLGVNVSAWSISGCKPGGANGCTVSVTSLPYNGSLAWSSGQNGTLTMGSGGKAEPRLFVNCGEILSCEYKIPTATVVGGSSGQVTLAETKLTAVGGSNCVGEATLKPATYAVSLPKPVYVAKPPLEEAHTRLCKAAESPCSGANTYPFGTTIEAESTNLVIKTTSPNFTYSCAKATMSAKTLAVGAAKLPLGPPEFTLTECVSTNFGKCSSVTSTPYEGGFISSEGFGYMQLPAAWKFTCGTPAFECVLSLKEGVYPAFYGSGILDKERAAFEFTEKELKPESPICALVNKLSATFFVNSPKPLFAT